MFCRSKEFVVSRHVELDGSPPNLRSSLNEFSLCASFKEGSQEWIRSLILVGVERIVTKQRSMSCPRLLGWSISMFTRKLFQVSTPTLLKSTHDETLNASRAASCAAINYLATATFQPVHCSNESLATLNESAIDLCFPRLHRLTVLLRRLRRWGGVAVEIEIAKARLIRNAWISKNIRSGWVNYWALRY